MWLYEVTVSDPIREDGDVREVVADDHREACRTVKSQYLDRVAVAVTSDAAWETYWDELTCPHVVEVRLV